MRVSTLLLLVALFALPALAQGQAPDDKLMRWELGEGRYVQATFLNQVWVRYAWQNPGTAFEGQAVDQFWDISLRRTRFQLFGQLSRRVFFYSQFGLNNYNFATVRKSDFFLHDALVELAASPKKLHIGAGLTAWGGPLRYTAPAAASILSLDTPIYQQTNNDVNDQFDRRLALYAKGQLGKFTYRLVLARPLALSNASVGIDTLRSARVPDGTATFSLQATDAQFSGYFTYNFLDAENNTLPYMTGSYLGQKEVLTVGAGFLYQGDAMWSVSGTDTARHAQTVFGLDVFYDRPMGSQGASLTAYASALFSEMGPNYVRNLGPDNALGQAIGNTAFNGPGVNYPMYGSGATYYANAGYKLPDGLLGEMGTLQPFVALQLSDFDRLAQNVFYYEAGLNWLLNGHAAKATLGYQDRPVFDFNASNALVETSRRGALVLQLQVFVQ